ncbi:MAG: recombination protein RecR, partial [Clostridia bacterium]|nr:recombination protein RecR [Clostridia bacterium]
MMEYAEPLQRLIEQFRRLPGIGGKSAVRMAFSVLSFSDEEAETFAEAVLDAKRSIRSCRVCGNFSTGDVCPICADPERDRTTVCVLENARDILAFERVREYRGLYHVLGGALS